MGVGTNNSKTRIIISQAIKQQTVVDIERKKGKTFRVRYFNIYC